MSADTFLERLSSLVPRPRTNQVLYRGVLAAHSVRRPHVVPQPDEEAPHRPRNATFCELMKHGLGVDILACPCGHRMKYVATIFDTKGLARHAASPRAHPPRERATAAGSRLRPVTAAAVRGARARAQVRPQQVPELRESPRRPHAAPSARRVTVLDPR
jgi:hypothetical protein